MVSVWVFVCGLTVTVTIGLPLWSVCGITDGLSVDSLTVHPFAFTDGLPL